MPIRQRSTRSRRIRALTASCAGLLALTGLPFGGTAAAAPGVNAEGVLRGMTLEQKIGQLFVATVYGKSANEVHPGNLKAYGVGTAAEVVRKYGVGGVIYFNNSDADNVDDPAQVARFSNGLQRAALTSGSHLPLIISIDQEGGQTTRISAPATEYPSSMALGAGRSTPDARQVAAINGRELRAMGINQDFAPVADVNSNPLNPVIGTRSFSADPKLASEFVAAEVDGYQRSGRATGTVSTAAKHFPGHGDAAEDSHSELPVIKRTEAQWRQTDLPPFQAAIAAGVDSIMTAHISVPSLDPSGNPATLSKPIMTGLLRNELKYDGVVVTDALRMDGVRKMYPDSEVPVLALEAGVDQMLLPPDFGVAVKGVLDAVRSGRLTEQRIDQSVLRILKLKFKRGILAKPLVDERAVHRIVGTRQHLDAVARITGKTTTALRNDAGLLPLKNPGKVLVTGWNNPEFPGYPADPVTALAKRMSGTALPTGADPAAAKVDQAIAAAKNADTVVVLTNGLRTSTGQTNLVNALRSTGKPVIAVAIQEPYDPGFADMPTWLATYDWRDVTMSSLAKVLRGELAPQGKLPVDVPAGTDPGKILFPFGHGLRW
ncbi:glycoside hydrolase family 3 protein [Amycolatopsis anabasis]|uniref:glycoside hydrolase family 3 protein n=1 Tax=Amycolatopsis anabasis TaxID=1840409 RepID=UPI00131C6FC8|nr:glycoside hydrolase family 3 protein [Amycolatopsis anabasis]